MYTQGDYNFYSKQALYIMECKYSNPKIRVKCFTDLKQDIQEYIELNNEDIKEYRKNLLKEFKGLLFVINDELKKNQLIIDRNKT